MHNRKRNMSQANNNHRKNSVARLLGNLKQRVIGDTTPHASLEQSHQASVRFESLEPRVLLAGDMPSMIVSDSLAVAGETRSYQFHTDSNQRVILDTLTENSSLTWRLTNGQGVETGSHGFDGADISNLAPLDLAAGNYTLTIDGQGDAIGAYSFRFINLAEAELVQKDQPIAGQLELTGQMKLYQFTAQAQERILVDWQNVNGRQANWRLLNMAGQPVTTAQNVYNTPSPIVLPTTGDYLLIIESEAEQTVYEDTTDYQFTLTTLIDQHETLDIEQIISTELNPIFPSKSYDFHLDQAGTFYFDALSNSEKLTWSLRGPRGEVVSERQFVRSDSTDLGGVSPLLALVAGDYTLVVTITDGWYGEAQFRLLDLGQGTSITANTPITGTLNPANSTHLFHLQAQANERFYFDKTLLSTNEVYWRLLDPYGNEVSGFELSTMRDDVGVIALPYTGIYTLLIEGRIQLTGQADYAFTAQRVVDDTQTVALDTPIQGAISHVGQQDYYHFSVADDKTLYLDGLQDLAQGSWSLWGEHGQVVTSTTQSTVLGHNRVLGSAGMDLIYSGDSDDDSHRISSPFLLNFLGQSYDALFVGTNGYITFEGVIRSIPVLQRITPHCQVSMYCLAIEDY
jgi:hypothetical protein